MPNTDHQKDSPETGKQGFTEFDEFVKQFEPLIQQVRARRKKMLWGMAIGAVAGSFITQYALASTQAGFTFFIVAMVLLHLQAERTKI